MLQRSLPSAPTVEIAESLQRTLDRRWVRSLQDLLPLPETWQQYMVLLVIVLAIAGGMSLQIMLSVQTAQAEFQARQLRAEYAQVQRTNSELVFQIANRTGLVQIEPIARAQGYMPATGRVYVRRDQLAAVPIAVGTGSSTAGAAAAQQAVIPVQQPPPPQADWLAQGRQWWTGAQQAAQAAMAQLNGSGAGGVR